MEQSQLIIRLEKSLTDREALEGLAADLGFAETGKTAANIEDLHKELGNWPLLAGILCDALETADPDMALNSLERFLDSGCYGQAPPLLAETHRRRQLLTIFGASQFLTGILCRNADYFENLLSRGEIDHFKEREAMLADLRGAIPEDADFARLQQGLRHYKSQEILRIGARDLNRIDDVVAVMVQLSDLASACLQLACEICGIQLQTEVGIPYEHDEEGRPEREATFTVLGMGKLGGRELNFSSDVDLIYIYSGDRGRTAGVEDGRGGVSNAISLHSYFVKLSEMVTRAIGEVTEDGFVFRVDLDLRPEGRAGEMTNSLRAAELYYESWGRSWERAALIKARPVAGDLELGRQVLEVLEPFVFRRYLDYGMIEDIKGMKQRIDHSLAMQRGREFNLKLGQGGIREIEFFIQTLQLIYAGKNPLLRERNSLQALDLLLDEELIEEQSHHQLRSAYIFLRDVEHRIQMVQERQTQSLPKKEEEHLTLARRCGFSDVEPFLKQLEDHRQAVHAIYRDLFYTAEEEFQEDVSKEVRYLLDPKADTDLVLDILEASGFKNPAAAYDTLQSLRDGPPHSHLTEQALRQLKRITPLLVQAVLDSPDPNMALLNLGKFLDRLRARGTFYALLAENREIIKVLVNLFGSSQFLSRNFIQHPEILDSLVARSYAAVFKNKEQMKQDLESLFLPATDYEARLDMLRRFRSEEFLRLALNDISGVLQQGESTLQLSYLAEICLQKAVEMAREELVPRFGLPFSMDAEGKERETGFAIVGLGKLGGRELNYHSDLDIIFIYEDNGHNYPVEGTEPSRFKRQSNQEYFARLAQRVISILSLLTREGKVYEIDTRLRPSGNQGPLVTSFSAFEKYHLTSAQSWERQALTKARVVTAPEDFGEAVEKLRRQLVFERPLPDGLQSEILRLRRRMEAEIAKEGESSFNIKTGRGGLVDVEFIIQYLQLLHGKGRPSLQLPNTLQVLEGLEKEGLLGVEDASALADGYKFLRRLENKLRLLHDHSISELSANRGYLNKLARTLGYQDKPRRPEEAFLDDYMRITDRIRQIFERYLGPGN